MKPDIAQKTKDVGFGKPPKHAQFKKGQSGNPKGRPKGTLNIATVLERALRQRVVTKENGKRKITNMLEAAVTQLANKAASGDIKAVQLLMVLVRSIEDHVVQGDVPNCVTEEVDEKVVIGILKRIGTTDKEEQEDGNETVAE